MKSKQFKRKYIVHAKYQLTQAAAMIIANLSIAFLMVALLSWFYLLIWDGHGSVIYNHNQMIPVYLICVTILISLLSLFWSLRRSRTIAGMIKKIDNVLTEASHGIFPERPLGFRKGDHFTSLSVSLNRCLSQLKKKDINENSEIVSIQALMNRIDSGGMSNKEVLSSLSDILKRLEGN
jgi:hypothetical protein